MSPSTSVSSPRVSLDPLDGLDAITRKQDAAAAGRAQHLVRSGHIRRAAQALNSTTTMADCTDPAVQEKLRELHPQLPADIQFPVMPAEAPMIYLEDDKDIRRILKHSNNGATGGPSGCNYLWCCGRAISLSFEQNRPGHARHLVGQRYGCYLLALAGCEINEPRTQAGRLLGFLQQHGVRSLHKEFAQVFVSSSPPRGAPPNARAPGAATEGRAARRS